MNSKEKPVVVCTGFGPFSFHTRNPSWEAVKKLPALNLEAECDVKLVIKNIKVTYDEVNDVIPELWASFNPILMVHCGVSHVASRLTLESCANKHGYYKEDVDNCIIPDGCNCNGEVEYLRTNIDLQKITEEAKACSMDFEISDDASRYLCEYIFYTSLSIDNNRTIFIHVPIAPDESSVIRIAQEIKLVIKSALKQLRSCSQSSESS